MFTVWRNLNGTSLGDPGAAYPCPLVS